MRYTQLALVALAAFPGIVQAQDRFTIREREVIPVKFDSTISAKSNRRGDKFSTQVENDRFLPTGTKLRGVVREISRKDGDRKAYAELEFTEIELPSGERIRIEAYPIPLSDKYVSRDKNGRIEAKKGTRKENVVLGGTAGGLILGSLIKKPLEGAIIGLLGGILVAETDTMNSSGEQIVEKGQKVGAAFDRDVVINLRDYDRNADRRDRDDDRDNRDDRDSRDNRDDRDNESRSDIRVEYDNKELRFNRDAMPYREGSTTMVPLIEMADQLGIDVDRTGDKYFYLEDQDNLIKLEQNSSDYRLNGRRASLPRAIVEKDGVTYVPIEAFAAIKKDSLFVNGTRVVIRS